MAYLEHIDTPADLRRLDASLLPQVCDELRQYIIDQVSSNPGHLGSSLGTVELAVALHYVYDTPRDRLVWDVGHQAYGHKILTGRREAFATNRKHGGISGFPRRSESEYDAFGTGHSSTSVSAALGMAVSAALDGDREGEARQHAVAIIGDGALTGGMAIEGLNNAGALNTRLLVILNDNNMSIDPAAGAFKDYLIDISTSATYNRLKDEVWNMLSKIGGMSPKARDLVQNVGNGLKSILLRQSNFFESIGFRYFGPVDGHDVGRLVEVLRDLKEIDGPKLLHIKTVKGKGFSEAERDQTIWHAPGRFNKETGERLAAPKTDQPAPPKYQEVFGHTVLDLARANDKIVGITPAMMSGCSLDIMARALPGRVFDVTIAEQHAVTFAAGLAAEGKIPFCNIYSSFAQRAFDQIVHDVALQGLHVVLCLDRAGLVGEDGATHHGALDLAYLRCVPGMTVAAPMDEVELRNMMYTAQLPGAGPTAIRYPRGQGVTAEWRQPYEKLRPGRGRQLAAGTDVALVTLGHPGNFAREAVGLLAQEGISASHYDMRYLKPLDEELLSDILARHPAVVTVEDGAVNGGLGSAVAEYMADHGARARLARLGIPDRFVEHGTVAELRRECGIDTQGIVEAARKAARKQ